MPTDENLLPSNLRGDIDETETNNYDEVAEDEEFNTYDIVEEHVENSSKNVTASLPPPIDFESHYEVKPQEEEYQLITIHQKPSIDRMDQICLLYTSPSPRDRTRSRMPSSA